MTFNDWMKGTYQIKRWVSFSSQIK